MCITLQRDLFSKIADFKAFHGIQLQEFTSGHLCAGEIEDPVAAQFKKREAPE